MHVGNFVIKHGIFDSYSVTNFQQRLYNLALYIYGFIESLRNCIMRVHLCQPLIAYEIQMNYSNKGFSDKKKNFKYGAR